MLLLLQEALDADEHPDMMDFSDHADGLQRTNSDVSHKHNGKLVGWKLWTHGNRA